VRVLVVDDYVDNVESMARLLRMYGHEVATAHDGAAAIEAALRDHPEVVLLDIAMPGMNGYDVARQLRDLLPGNIVLIALTAFGFEEEGQRCSEAGFDFHVTKPADPVKLELLIRGMIGSSSRDHHRLR
jgi:CheY-like chemotaxis protein